MQPAKALESPKLALIFAFDRDRERPLSANPPFGSIQRAFAFQGAATPASEFRLPFGSEKEAVDTHDRLVVQGDRHVFLGSGVGRAANDSTVLKKRPNIFQWTNFDLGLQLLR